MAPPCSLVQTPSDVQLEIVALLDPPDIISLSETCHTLHQICSQRMVWAHAFRQMCSQNEVFGPSYPPVENMSIGELRQHALSPYKLLSLLYEDDNFTGQSRQPDPVQRNIICPNSEDSSNTHFGSMFLVPGGRYLVTESGDDESEEFRIDIWDLSLDTKGSPPLVATWVHGGTDGCWAVSPSKLDISEFLIATVRDTQFCISSFNSLLPGPKISPVASFSCGVLPNLLYFFNDPFLIYFAPVLTVCNFRENLWASYRLDVDPNDAEVVLHGDVIIICVYDPSDRATFYGLKLSKLEPHLEYLNRMNSAEIQRDTTPLFVLTHKVPVYENPPLQFLRGIAPLDQWYASNDPSSPFPCDIILRREVGITALLCCIQLSASCTGHRIEEIAFKTPPFVEPLHTNSGHNCHRSGGHLLRAFWVNGDRGIQIQVIATPIDNGASESHLRRCNFTGFSERFDRDQMWESVVFDYVSGRSCVHLSGNRIIDILEFLRPPNTKA